MKKISKVCCFLLVVTCITCQNPFTLLGIPTLNPSQIFREESEYSNSKQSQNSFTTSKTSSIKSLNDLPAFLQKLNLNEEEGLKVISKYLLSDDFNLKKYGVIFDQTGFDGLMSMEQIYPVGSKERLIQRARSSAKIYV